MFRIVAPIHSKPDWRNQAFTLKSPLAGVNERYRDITSIETQSGCDLCPEEEKREQDIIPLS
jgi:hypothetical protein